MELALIGSGFIVDSFVAAAGNVSGVHLHTAVSRSRAQAEENRRRWSTQEAREGLDGMLADGRVDAVYIATPNAVHAEQIEACLCAGKHVLCEKPVVPDAGTFMRLQALAREKGLVLMEAMRPVHFPFIDRIREKIEAIGPVRFAEFPYCQYSSRYDRFRAGIVENAFRPELCNGALMDIGVYCAAWMELLFGLPQEIEAQAVFLPGSIDAVGSALCRYAGMTAALVYSKVHDGGRVAVIEGERGRLCLEIFPMVDRMTLRFRGGDGEVLPLVREELDMAHELRDFIRCCDAPKTAGSWNAHTLNVLRIMDRIRTAAGIDFKPRP